MPGTSLLPGTAPIRGAKERKNEVHLYSEVPHPGLLQTRLWGLQRSHMGICGEWHGTKEVSAVENRPTWSHILALLCDLDLSEPIFSSVKWGYHQQMTYPIPDT